MIKDDDVYFVCIMYLEWKSHSYDYLSIVGWLELARVLTMLSYEFEDLKSFYINLH